MMAQRSLFTESPPMFAFPWSVLGAVFVGALSLSVVSAALPSWRLASQPIAKVVRSYL